MIWYIGSILLIVLFLLIVNDQLNLLLDWIQTQWKNLNVWLRKR